MKTLPACFFLSIVSLLPFSKSLGQDRRIEIQLYTAPLTLIEAAYGSDGPLEYGGPSLEFYIKESTSIGLSASWNSTINDELFQVIRNPTTDHTFSHDYSLQEKNRVVNFYFKRYSEQPRLKTFIGGYLRYWSYQNERLETTQYSQEYLAYLIDAKVPLKYHDHKVSIGFLTGIKAELSEIVYLSLNGGIGISLPFMYVRNEKHFNEEDNRVVTLKNAEDYTTSNHLSILFHVALGFRF